MHLQACSLPSSPFLCMRLFIFRHMPAALDDVPVAPSCMAHTQPCFRAFFLPRAGTVRCRREAVVIVTPRHAGGVIWQDTHCFVLVATIGD